MFFTCSKKNKKYLITYNLELDYNIKIELEVNDINDFRYIEKYIDNVFIYHEKLTGYKFQLSPLEKKELIDNLILGLKSSIYKFKKIKV